ncbi:MAG: hypothetical protein PSY14_13475 [bacterium]|nr:hypothetical protein [bacterium]
MQEFSETGLPWDQNVFKAYLAYEKTPGLTGESEQHPVRVAQLFNNVAAADTQLQALSLLAYIPEDAYGQLERRFGKETTDFAREISAHMRTNWAYIDEASPKVKAFVMADNITWIDELQNKFYDIAQAVNEAQENGEQPQVQMPMIPSQRVLDNIAKFAVNSSGFPTLDGEYIDKIEEFRRSLPEKLEVFGLKAPPVPEFKPFAETGLLDSPDVKNAYAALAANPRVRADDAEVAVEAAQLLSSQPSTRNPVAIAATLLDVGIGWRGPDDFKFLGNRVSDDVLDLFEKYNVRDRGAPEGLVNAPVEYRQSALAFATVILHRSLKNLDKMFTFINDNPDRFEDSQAKLIKSTQLVQMGGLVKSAQKFLAELGDAAEAPELKGLYETKIETAEAFIAKNTPKPILMLPAPKKKPGKDFDL